MPIQSDIRPITYLKSKASELLKKRNKTHPHVIITQNGEPRAVLQDPTSFEEMKTAPSIMKLIHQSEEAIRDGKTTRQEDVFKELDARLIEDLLFRRIMR